MKPLTARKLIRILEEHGFHKTRQRGSHAIFLDETGHIVPVPLHGKNQPIHLGTFLAIVKQSGIAPDKFV